MYFFACCYSSAGIDPRPTQQVRYIDQLTSAPIHKIPCLFRRSTDEGLTCDSRRLEGVSEVLRCEEISRESLTGRETCHNGSLNRSKEGSISCGHLCERRFFFERRFVSVAKNPKVNCQNKKRQEETRREHAHSNGRRGVFQKDRCVAEGSVVDRVSTAYIHSTSASEL